MVLDLVAEVAAQHVKQRAAVDVGGAEQLTDVPAGLGLVLELLAGEGVRLVPSMAPEVFRKPRRIGPQYLGLAAAVDKSAPELRQQSGAAVDESRKRAGRFERAVSGVAVTRRCVPLAQGFVVVLPVDLIVDVLVDRCALASARRGAGRGGENPMPVAATASATTQARLRRCMFISASCL